MISETNWPSTVARTDNLLDRHTHTHTRLTALFPGLPGWASTRKVKPIWILLKQETVSGSGISWAVCKSAPRSRQITMPAPHHSIFYRPDALLPPNQQHQSTEGLYWVILITKVLTMAMLMGSHSFTCLYHVYLDMEWTILLLLLIVRASPHFGRYSFPVPLRIGLGWHVAAAVMMNTTTCSGI